MEQDRYLRLLAEFDGLIELGVSVSARTVGMLPTEMHLNYLDAIYTKILAHAISLRRLSPALPEVQGQIWDPASASAVARCLIEAHDLLSYMAHQGEGPEEQDFRVLLWRLHDAHRRIKMADAIGSMHPKVQQIRDEASSLKKQVTEHRWFTRLSNGMQRKVQDDDAPHATLTQKAMNERNVVNHDYHTAATMWLSQYVHTYPMSVHQLRAFRAGTAEALNVCAMPIQYACGFLASAIAKMVDTFPSAAPTPTSDQQRALSSWLAAVRNGVKGLPASAP